MNVKHTTLNLRSRTRLHVWSLFLILMIILGGTGSPVQARPLLASGDLDTTFSYDGKQTTTFVTGESARLQDLVILPSGKIVAVGYSSPSETDSNFALARYTSSGALDSNFSGDGMTLINLAGNKDQAFGIAIQPVDKKVVVTGQKCPEAGTCNSATLRLKPGGGLDLTFDGDGKRIDDFGGLQNGSLVAAVDADGKILVAGSRYTAGVYYTSDFAVFRYTSSGALDNTFSADGKAAISFGSDRSEGVTGIAIQPDGKILLAGGTCTVYYTECNFAMVRLNNDGSLDNTFSGDGKLTTNFGGEEFVMSMALQPDGKIVLVGAKDDGTRMSFALARYDSSGNLDSTFSGDGRQVTDFSGDANEDYASDVLVQPDGKIVVCGAVKTGTTYDFALARYTSTGELDSSFSVDGKTTVDFGRSDRCLAIAAQEDDGKYVLGGYSYSNSLYRWVLARVLP